jgi:hypothetical protein
LGLTPIDAGTAPVEEDEAAERAAEEDKIAEDVIPEEEPSAIVVREEHITCSDDVDWLETREGDDGKQCPRQQDQTSGQLTSPRGAQASRLSKHISPAAFEVKLTNRFGALHCLSQLPTFDVVENEAGYVDLPQQDLSAEAQDCTTSTSASVETSTKRKRRRPQRSSRPSVNVSHDPCIFSCARDMTDAQDGSDANAKVTDQTTQALGTSRRRAARAAKRASRPEGARSQAEGEDQVVEKDQEVREEEKVMEEDGTRKSVVKEDDQLLQGAACSSTAENVQGDTASNLQDPEPQDKIPLTGDKADFLAMMTAKMHATPTLRYMRQMEVRKFVLAVPVDAADPECLDMLDVMLGMIVHCEALDPPSGDGWAIGTIVAPREFAQKRGCFRCHGMRPIVVEARSNGLGDQLEWLNGSWEQVGQMQPRTTQNRLRQKALLNRIKAARDLWTAKAIKSG